VEALNLAGGPIFQEKQGLLPELLFLGFSPRMQHFKRKAAKWGRN
jgi:hypothetical protein